MLILVMLSNSGHADYRLVVKPQLCITTVQRPACAVEVALSWQAPAPGDHCVFSDQSETPRACWQASATGAMIENQVLEQSRNYWLTATDAARAQRLAQAEIKVLAAKSSDKRRNRRRRHVWSVL